MGSMNIKINSKYKFTGGDEMSHYDASFETNPTLEEFVNWIITKKKEEWGDIEDCEHNDPEQLPYKFNKKIVEYKWGKILKVCEDYEQLKNKTIALTKMDGGWSAMDYTIKFID